jgi:RNA polymerase sigma factor FliA
VIPSEHPAHETSPRVPRLTREEYDRFSPFIRRQAIWLARRSPCRVTVQTLCSYGWQGLIEAIGQYAEVDAVTDLESFVQHRVKAAMTELITLLDEKSRAARNMATLLTRSIGALSRALGRSPTSEEVAAAMSLDAKAYEEALVFTLDAGVARLYGLDVVADPDSDDEALASSLGDAIALLDDALQTLLLLIYQERCSHDEAARVLDTTERQVKMLHAEAIFRIRVFLGRE